MTRRFSITKPTEGNKMKNYKITMFGGFHKSSPLRMVVRRHAGEMHIPHPAVDMLHDLLSERQIVRADRHFCGIKGCEYGGSYRCTWELA